MTRIDAATRARLAAALQGATSETLREDAQFVTEIAAHLEMYIPDAGPVPFPPIAARLAALALAVAEMQERAASAIPQQADRPHVVFWSADSVGGMDWIIGDVGDNAERSLMAALAAFLRSGA